MGEEKNKKKKLSSSGMSTRDRLIQRKKDFENKNKGGLVYPKEGTLRLRIKSPGDDQELLLEIIQFYLGRDLGGVISPATFGEPCPFMEKYKELKESSDEDDRELAKELVPKRKYVLGAILYKDEKGKEIDPDGIDKGVMVARGVYQDIIDLYLDEDEWGDMTDPSEGYDIKISRSGSGKNDTSYTVSPCQKKKIDKKYQGTIDLEGIVRAQIKSYDELEELLSKFLNVPMGDDEDDEDEKPKKKKKSKDSEKPKKKKKKFKGDI